MKKRNLFIPLLAGLLSAWFTPLAAQETEDPLFRCVFNKAADLNDNWTLSSTRDNNWKLRPITGLSSDNENGNCAWANSAYIEEPGTDYLIMKNPVALTTEGATLTYYWGTRSFAENYSVLYGTENDPEKMDTLASFLEVKNQFVDDSTEWLRKYLHVRPKQAGDYYFAFAYTSVDKMHLYIDDVQIFNGIIKAPSVIDVVSASLPISSCGLDKERVGVKLLYRGTDSSEKIKIICRVNGELALEEEMNVTIVADEAKEVTTQKTLDLSAEGDYVIVVSATVDGGEDEGVSDTLYRSHWTETPLPFETNFTKPESEQDWAFENDSWMTYSDIEFLMCNGTEPIYSRCMTLQKDTLYRIRMNLLAGSASAGESFIIQYGVPGTDITGWDTVKYFEDAFTYESFAFGEITFSPKADGIYSIAIRSCSEASFGSLAFRYFRVRKVENYDAALYQYDYFPTRMPAKQAKQGFELPIVVENEGRFAINKVNVTVEMEGKKVGEKSFSVGEAYEYNIQRIPVKIEDFTVGNPSTLTVNVSIDGVNDGYTDNNTLTHHWVITEDLLAYDMVDSASRELKGYGGSTVVAPLNFPSRDTLTAVKILWTETATELQVPVSIYEFDWENETLGREIYTQTYTKAKEAGWAEYAMPSLLLAPGYYAVTVGLGKNDYCLVLDEDEEGMSYTLHNGSLISMEGYGNAAVRAVFGANAHPVAKDVAVRQMRKPYLQGVYAENEPIIVSIANNGFETLSVTVNASVDGTALDAQKTSLKPYEIKDVTFYGNLAAVGEHTIGLGVGVQGDENPENDSLTVNVKSIASANPYVMDFENNADFAYDGFNPRWTTVDADGQYTYSNFLNLPHMGEKYAFITYTDTLIENAESYGLAAQEGHKFGASLSALSGANDDWLISPALTLPEKGASVSLWVKTYEDIYGLENYEVLVSKTPNPEDFVVVHAAEADPDWEKVTVDLSPYAGREMYIAVRCVSYDKFIFMVDNIRVSQPTANEPLTATSLKIYPNPAGEMITLRADGAVIEQVDIVNLSGRILYSSSVNAEVFRYNVSTMPAGLYFARVKTSRGTGSVKFVVE